VTAKRGLYLEVMPLLIDQIKRGVKIEKVLKKLLLKRELT
jgi:hypothetical protein